MLKPYINTRMLKRIRACATEVALFKKTFPLLATVGVPITLANVRKAHKAGLDITYASGEFFKRYLPAAQCNYGLTSCNEHRNDSGFTPELFMKVYRAAKKAEK